MGKCVFIAEKPSVALEFGKTLGVVSRDATGFQSSDRNRGYAENQQYIITWCFGHLITMSYPDKYDPKLKRWALDTLPFIPEQYQYEVIDSASKQFDAVSALLKREDVSTIYVCTDSGREGEYIYRLVEMYAGVTGKERKRVWIDSQTEEEIRRGIKEAKDLSAYDDLSQAAYLRAQEDYLMGINFSRALTLKYSDLVKSFLKRDKAVISVGRVMTCVLGIVVNREREIRDFTKTPFYRVIAGLSLGSKSFDGEWKAQELSRYYQSPALYKENGFKEKESAEELIRLLEKDHGEELSLTISAMEKKKETKNPPLLYNLAEAQNDCSKFFKISPAETLQVIQELYEKKLVTYPRTDARVLSTAVAKVIANNIGGLRNFAPVSDIAKEVLAGDSYKTIAKTKYVNDKQITDHYAIIPTGQGFQNLGSLRPIHQKVYELIARRFLAIFYPAAVYQKVSLICEREIAEDLPEIKGSTEKFFSSFKVLTEEGYLAAMKYSFFKKNEEKPEEGKEEKEEEEDTACDQEMLEALSGLKKGMRIPVKGFSVKEGETSPPKRYNSGALILTMENAGQFIEDEELREQIKGSGIGTSATRAEILNKLVKNEYLNLNNKTQIITPTLMGEVVYEIVNSSIKPMLDPRLTASWEKGLTGVADGSIAAGEYRSKLNDYVARRTNAVKQLNNQRMLYPLFTKAAEYYKKPGKMAKTGTDNKEKKTEVNDQ
ncbi:MAG: type IA DNA topoisomerase [Lachnospiraceae bacterium]|nr:type IA DNA topoisomerase [Lachnospiraceae bacterium]